MPLPHILLHPAVDVQISEASAVAAIGVVAFRRFSSSSGSEDRTLGLRNRSERLRVPASDHATMHALHATLSNTF